MASTKHHPDHKHQEEGSNTMTKPLTFTSGNKFVEHVLAEPTDGAVPTLKKGMSRLKDQRTALKAERDQAQATVSAATQQVADMAIKGKSAKAINEVLADAAHARFSIATIDEQLDIVSKAGTLISSQLFHVMRDNADWRQYIATCQRWRRIFDDGLHAIQREHMQNPISPAHVTGREPKKAAQLQADKKMTERWQASLEDLADEMLFRFERENEPVNEEEGSSKRRLRSRL
jgi:hypothetical protein